MLKRHSRETAVEASVEVVPVPAAIDTPVAGVAVPRFKGNFWKEVERWLAPQEI